MPKKLFVGQLKWEVTDEQLKEKFESIGPVVSAHVLTDRESGRSRGFGFVEMENEEDAKTAMETFDGKDWLGRNIEVREALPQKPMQGGFQQRGGDRGGYRGGDRGGRSFDRGNRYGSRAA